MKKKSSKRKSMGKLKSEADRAMQDHFRRVKTKCEMCGGQYQVAHHFIHKSQSNYLRYDEKNLIFICNSCHSKFHRFPEPMMAIWAERLRGTAWVKYIEKYRHTLKRDNRVELIAIKEKYSG